MSFSFGNGIRPLEVTTLPAASSTAGQIFRQGGRLWYSNGTTWFDLSQGSGAEASGTASSVATLDIALPTGYREFSLHATRLEPATANVALWCRVSYDDGASWQSGAFDYWQGSVSATSGGSVGSGPAGYNSAIVLGNNQAVAGGWNGLLTMTITNAPGFYALVQSRFTARPHGGGLFGVSTDAQCLATGDRVTNIRLLYSSGNISACHWQLYARRA